MTRGCRGCGRLRAVLNRFYNVRWVKSRKMSRVDFHLVISDRLFSFLSVSSDAGRLILLRHLLHVPSLKLIVGRLEL